MATLKKEIWDQFQQIINQRDEARHAFSRAQETITILEGEIATIKYHGDEAFGKVADSQGISRHRNIETKEEGGATHWIDDIWLSTLSNEMLLGKAEKAWKGNMQNPQEALNLVTEAIKRTTTRSDRIKCKLFVSAICLASGQTEESCAHANDALRECGTDWRYKHLAGIAHYLRGRVFLEIRSFRQAYWDFSLAIFTKGYHKKVKYYQGHTENRILQEDDNDMTSMGGDQQPTTPSFAPHNTGALHLSPAIQVPLDGFAFERPPGSVSQQ